MVSFMLTNMVKCLLGWQVFKRKIINKKQNLIELTVVSYYIIQMANDYTVAGCGKIINYVFLSEKNICMDDCILKEHENSTRVEKSII